jgi:NADPH-dependent ferric siderophore reductase
VLAGDDAALPAIETILDALPAEARVRVLLEVADEHEQRPLSTAAQLDITWLHRGAHPDQADTALEEALRMIELPAGNGRIYVGCEAAAMRRIRKHLLHERGLDPATIVTRGYWKLGAVDYTDHDYGTDSES